MTAPAMTMTTTRKPRSFSSFLLFSILILFLGCEGENPAPTQTAKPQQTTTTNTTKVLSPSGPVLFQPAFDYSGEISYNGTGFFAAAPGGKVIGVISAHFVDFVGLPLVDAAFLSVDGEELVAEFAFSYGEPGDGGSDFTMDLSSDYMLLSSKEPIEGVPVLELDPRRTLSRGERVWLPNKGEEGRFGYRLVSGTVAGSKLGVTVVVLDRLIELQSQSGSPLISQRSGKVVGTLSRGGEDRGRTVISITPSHAILSAINGAKREIPLSEVTGR